MLFLFVFLCHPEQSTSTGNAHLPTSRVMCVFLIEMIFQKWMGFGGMKKKFDKDVT